MVHHDLEQPVEVELAVQGPDHALEALEPVPADFQGVAPDAPHDWGFGATVFACIPDAEALTTAAIWEKEQLARIVGR